MLRAFLKALALLVPLTGSVLGTLRIPPLLGSAVTEATCSKAIAGPRGMISAEEGEGQHEPPLAWAQRCVCMCVCPQSRKSRGCHRHSYFAPVTAIVPGHQHCLQPWQGIYFILFLLSNLSAETHEL